MKFILLFSIESFWEIIDRLSILVIINENISAISSEAVDIAYSVINPLESLIKDKSVLFEQVEHSAYLKLGILNFSHLLYGNKLS